MALLRKIKDDINANSTNRRSDIASFSRRTNAQAYTDSATRDKTEKDYYDSKWLKDRFSSKEIALLKKEFGIASDSRLKAKVESMDDYDLDVLLHRLKNPAKPEYPDYQEPSPAKKPPTAPAAPSTPSQPALFPDGMGPGQILDDAVNADIDSADTEEYIPDYVQNAPWRKEQEDAENGWKPSENITKLLNRSGIGTFFGLDNSINPPFTHTSENVFSPPESNKKDNSFWEAHPGYYEIALKKTAQDWEEKRKAQEAEDKFNRDLENKIPGWEDMPSYERKQIKDSIRIMNEHLTTFPQEFVELYEQWKALRSQTNTNNRSIVDNEAKLEKKEDELEKTKSFEKFEDAFFGLKFDISKLPVVVLDTLELALYGLNFEMVPPSAIAEAIAAAGYDFADFLDASSLKKYLNKKWMIENEIHQLETDIKNARNNNSDISSANIGNYFSSDTIKSLENKMERKYPGMKARYEKYLNGSNG